MSKKVYWIVASTVIAGCVLLSSFFPTKYPVFEYSVPAISKEKQNVLVFGGTRNTGLEVVRRLVARGDIVTAFVRPASDHSNLLLLGVDLVLGDALDKESVLGSFLGEDYDAVITTIGCYNCNPRPDYLGNKNIVDAAAVFDVKRFILVTTIGAGDSFETAPWLVRRFLREVLPLKTLIENYLIASELDYTIIRPGGLTNGDVSGGAYLSESRDAFSSIGRIDLARLIVQSLDNDRTIKKVLAAVDSSLPFPWSMF
jgi:uncharacterized protein YbjT (DUF2867 family)